MRLDVAKMKAIVNLLAFSLGLLTDRVLTRSTSRAF
jgi:hypothetical protein